MFSKLKKVFGVITLRTRDDVIHVEGIPADVIRKDINKIWSNRISNNLFETMTSSSFSFCSWYALEVLYAIDEILKEKGSSASIRSLTKIREKLMEETWLKNTQLTFPSKMDMSALADFHYDPLEHQAPFFDYYDQITQKYGLNGILIAAAAGSGKAQPLDAKIKVPGGWSTMGEMQVGTEVIAADGTTTKVTAIYPQGIKQIYKFTFYDGRTVEACGEHLWRVTSELHSEHDTSEKWEIINTLEIIERLKNPQEIVYVQLAQSEDNPDIPLEMDPYTLGVILGGGEINQSVVSKEEILNTLQNNREFIPKHYFDGSKAQRLALLQGLLDTAGVINKDGDALSFCSTSETLARDVVYVVRSLGGIATVSTKEAHLTNLIASKAGELEYSVSIQYKKPSELFRLPSKRELTKDDRKYADSLKLSILSIEPSRITEAQCISIEHPEHLYVTDGFVVTHNTLLSLMTMRCLRKEVVIIVSPANALNEVWVKTLNTAFKKPAKFWTSKDSTELKKGSEYYVITYEYLPKLLEQLNKLDLANVGVILDESHRFNTADTLRTQTFIEICKQAKSKDVLWLSGTPIKALTTEVLAFFSTIDPLFTNEVIIRFKKIFGVSSARASDMMANRLGISLFKVIKAQLNLQEPIQKTVLVKVPNGDDFTLTNLSKKMMSYAREREVYYATRRKDDNEYFYGILDKYENSLKSTAEKSDYQKYRKDVSTIIKLGGDARWCAAEMKSANKYEKLQIVPTLSAEDKVKFKDVKSIVKYVKLKIQGEVLGRIVSRTRIDAAVAISKHINYPEVLEYTPKKTLIFTSYVEVIDAMKDYLPTMDLEARYVYAKTNAKLSSIINEFDNNEEINPLCATYASLSTAVPVTSASGVLTVDSPFREYILNQAISRAWRVGQDTQITVTTAILDTGTELNISSRSVQILTWSASQVEAITGVKSPVTNPDALDSLGLALENYLDQHDVSLEQFFENMYQNALEGYDVTPTIVLENKDPLPSFMEW